MNVRFAGMLVAVFVSYAAVVVPIDAVGLSPSFELGGIGLIGAPVAALLGWWLTPHVLAARWRFALVAGLGMGVLAAVLGVWEIAYLGLLEALAAGLPNGGSTLSTALLVALVGVPFSVVAMPITIVCGLAWAVVVRAGLRRLPGAGSVGPSPLGALHVAVLLGVVAIGAAIVPLVKAA